MNSVARAIVALGIPAGALLLPMPFLMVSNATAVGLPLAVLWLFLCLPLTALCLFIASRHGEDER